MDKSALSSPMSSRPYDVPGKGGMHPGDKDGLKDAVALGAPESSTKGGPVGLQITEEMQGGMPSGPTMPRGTSIYPNEK